MLLIEPFFSFLITGIIIASISNKIYIHYNCARITCFIISIIKTIAILIILIIILFFPNSSINTKVINFGDNLKIHNFRIFFIIGLIFFLLFVWLEGCVLVGYNRRVKCLCDNITKSNIINNVSNQPLINVES